MGTEREALLEGVLVSIVKSMSQAVSQFTDKFSSIKVKSGARMLQSLARAIEEAVKDEDALLGVPYFFIPFVLLYSACVLDIGGYKEGAEYLVEEADKVVEALIQEGYLKREES